MNKPLMSLVLAASLYATGAHSAKIAAADVAMANGTVKPAGIKLPKVGKKRPALQIGDATMEADLTRKIEQQVRRSLDKPGS